MASLREFHAGVTLVAKKFFLFPVAACTYIFLLLPLVVLDAEGAGLNMALSGHRVQLQLISIL